MKTLEERFWAKVDKNGPVPSHRPELGPCWIWIGGLDTSGYGNMTIAPRSFRSHRVSWEIHKGPIPPGLCVLHRCDNPRCVRIDHLFLGTVTDNARDMIKKGRKVVARGERHYRAKLTAARVRVIREEAAAGMSYPALGKLFGVTKGAIHLVVKGHSWRHVTQDLTADSRR